MVTATLATTVFVLNTRQEEVVYLQGFVGYKWGCSRISVVVVVAVIPVVVVAVVVAEHVVEFVGGVVVVAFDFHFVVAPPSPHLAFLSEASFIYSYVVQSELIFN